MFCASDKKTLNYSCAVKEKENASCRKDVIETSKGFSYYAYQSFLLSLNIMTSFNNVF
jgi:hypothetical protein